MPVDVEMIDVTSSNVAAVGYEPKSKTLVVDFNNGTRYEYYDVDVDVFNELKDSPSVGGYLFTDIKGIYDYNRVA